MRTDQLLRGQTLVSVTDWKNTETDRHSMSQLLSTQPRPLIGQWTALLASDWQKMIYRRQAENKRSLQVLRILGSKSSDLIYFNEALKRKQLIVS